MPEQVLTDYRGARIGTIRMEGGGALIAFDKFGRLAGRYEPVTNTTFDRDGGLTGRGNLLSALIVRYSA